MATQLGATGVGFIAVGAAQLAPTPIGFLGNALFLGPSGLSEALEAYRPWVEVPISLPEDLFEVLNPLALHLGVEAPAADVDRRQRLRDLADRLAQISDADYRRAAEKIGGKLGVFMKYPQPALQGEATFPVKQVPFLELEKHLAALPKKFNEEEVAQKAAAALNTSNLFFQKIWSGDIHEPPANLLIPILNHSFSILEGLRQYCQARDPFLGCKIFWESIQIYLNVVDYSDLREAFQTVDPWMELHLGRLFNGLEWQGTVHEFVEELRNRSLLPGKDDPHLPKIPEEERWPAGESDYVQEILDAAFEHGFNYVLHILRDCFEETTVRLFRLETLLSKAFSEYQRQRSQFPSAPDSLLFPLVAANVLKGADFPDLDESLLVKNFSPLIGMMERYVAALSEEEFKKYQAALQRDFPDAAFHHEGRKQTPDAEAIQRALDFRPEDRLVMHIGVQGDLELVKMSLQNIPPDGKVVLVDIESEVLETFRQNPDLAAAIQENRLILERADYLKSTDFREKYKGQVDRVYLLHPVGNPVPVMHDIVGSGGLVIYQQTSEVADSRYRNYDRGMFVEGDFARRTEYSNGPAWFQTEMAGRLRYLGIRFSVAQRIQGATSSKGSLHFKPSPARPVRWSEEEEPEEETPAAPSSPPIDYLPMIEKEWAKFNWKFRLRWAFAKKRILNSQNHSHKEALFVVLQGLHDFYEAGFSEEDFGLVLKTLDALACGQAGVAVAQIKLREKIFYKSPKVGHGVLAAPWRPAHLPKGIQVFAQVEKRPRHYFQPPIYRV